MYILEPCLELYVAAFANVALADRSTQFASVPTQYLTFGLQTSC
jgi:hypothetical protein